MYFAGIKLNLLSLGGLALGVGMLVDNAIVVLENIYRHRSEGRSMKEAAEKGTREIMLAISASTLTSVVVFLPIVFIEGITGTIFKEMALTITFSLLSSLLIAITFIPMVASRILKLEYRLEGRRSLGTWLMDIWDKQYQRLYRGYKRLLCGCIKRKAATIGTASVIMALSLISAVLIGYEYFPSMDEGYITLEVSLPRGSSLSETHEIAMVVQDRLDEIPEIRSIVMNLGAGGFVLDRSTTENAVITAGIGKAGERKRSIKQISDDIRKEMKDIPGAIIEITDSGNVMGFSLGSNEVEIRLYGEDMDKLRSMSEDLSAMVKGIEGIRDVTCSVEEEALEAVIHINRSKAALYHLTTAQIADSVITAVNGSVATQYQYRGSQIDVRVSSGTMGTKSIEALKSVALKSALGVSIPLSEIAEIKIEKTPATILRNNQRRCVTITAGTNGRALNHITRDIEKRFKGYTFPSGYSYGFGGQQEELFRSFDDLALALVLAVFIVYMLLASQFESLLHPFTIMLTVPLSLTGGLIALLITGYTLSIPSFIGIIILVGIVVNKHIVLIDTINRLREEGHTREEAVLKAGPLRLRPILMTTLTTLLGMLPWL
jgi:HAE1 family hydrophobic/amphiphilic exporter-1